MSEGNIKISYEKIANTIIGAVFVAVSLWIGSTVSHLSDEVIKLRISLEHQIDTSNKFQKKIGDQVDALEETVNIIRVEHAKLLNK